MAWTQIVTWLIVILGWAFVNHQNNLREKRKEIRSLIDSVNVQLNEIELLAIKYHTNEATEELAFQLKRSLSQQLLSKFKVLELRGFKIGSCDTYRKQLRKSVTLKNFDTNDYQVQGFSSEIVKDIWLTKDRLTHEMEKCFSRNYK